MADLLETVAKSVRKADKRLHDRWHQILALEGEVEELRQNRDKLCEGCERKSRKRLVGARGIEPRTPTMSNKGSQGKQREIKGNSIK